MAALCAGGEELINLLEILRGEWRKKREDFGTR